jgi:predicted permease
MEVFTTLLIKILPLYFLILLGFISGRYLNVQQESLAKLAIYIFVPIIMFIGIMKTNISIGVLMFPLIVFCISTTAAFTTLFLAHRFLSDKTQGNILALTAGTANSGYFGIPVAFIIFPDQPHIVGLYITCVFGMTLFQNTVGFYLTAKANFTPKESLMKVLRLPLIYTFALGAILNFSGFKIPEVLVPVFVDNIKGAYTVTGMMIIGVGLSQVQKFTFGAKFTALAFSGRFIIWPAIAASLIFIDTHFFASGLLGEDGHRVIKLACLVPLAADTVAISAILKCHPSETATAVLASSFFALFYVPLMVMWIF